MTHNGKLYNELLADRLRQGWGYDPRQALPDFTLDEGVKRNLRMYNEVKKGDYLLIPRMPTWHDVTIAEATEDWDEGYRFEIFEQTGDHGHIFPARRVTVFDRNADAVNASLKGSFRSSSRFWSLNGYAAEVERLIASDPEALQQVSSREERTTSATEAAFAEAFDDGKFRDALERNLNHDNRAADWEHVLVDALRELYPTYTVEPTGGRSEVEHGTDVLMRWSSPLGGDTEYGIAIQVKDHEGTTWTPEAVVAQIGRADAYYSEREPPIRVLERWIVITKGAATDNAALERLVEADVKATATGTSVLRVVYREAFVELLAKAAKARLGVEYVE